MCYEIKPLGEFHLYSRRGRQAWCKPCRREYDRAYHSRNAEKRRVQARHRRRVLVALNHELKSSRPCTDCGGRFHPAAMEWDHLPGTGSSKTSATWHATGKLGNFMRSLRSASSSVRTATLYARTNGAGVAQPGRAPALGAGGSRVRVSPPRFRNSIWSRVVLTGLWHASIALLLVAEVNGETAPRVGPAAALPPPARPRETAGSTR